MEPEFKIGDKVKLVEPSPRTRRNYPSLLVGEEGTVVHICYAWDALTSSRSKLIWGGYGRVDWADELLYGIEWRNPITNGENCQRNCKEGHGSYVGAYEIEKI